MKLLIFTAAHPEYGVHQLSRDSVHRAIAAYDGIVDWHICHNDNPYSQHPFENVVHNHKKGQQLALDGGYDAMLSIEADMIVPEHTLTALADVDADIVYGLYVWRVKRELRHKFPPRWSAYRELGLWGGESACLNRAQAREDWGNVIDASGLGMGCTLIRRRLLENVPFRIHDGNPGWIAEKYGKQIVKMNGWVKNVEINFNRPRPGMVANDWLMAMDAAHYGYTQKAHLGVVCGHINGDEILWPDANEQLMYRVEELNGIPDRG